jgi:ubiquinol-cytochrome c reductase iron-sulfur subunit
MSVRKVPPGLPTVAQPDRHRRFWVAITGAMGGVAVVTTAVPFVATLTPSERATAAGGAVVVDLSDIQAGATQTVAWRGKPVWVVRRTPAMLAALQGHDQERVDPTSARDQQPAVARNHTRSIKPDLFVALGICTHLGCSPNRAPACAASPSLPADRPGGYLCPCHGSTFDAAGRVFKNKPAPTNLEVSPHALWLCQRDTDRHRQRHGLTTRPHHQTPNHEATPWVFRTEATKPTSSSTRP